MGDVRVYDAKNDEELIYSRSQIEPETNKIRLAKNSPEYLYKKAVEEGKSLIMARNIAKIRVCELAHKVCEIQWGGGSHWSDFRDKYTIKKFAVDIGMHPKTLQNWMGIKVAIYDHLPEKKKKSFNWTCADRARSKLRSIKKSRALTCEEIEKVYEETKQLQKSNERRIDKYLFSLKHNIHKLNDSEKKQLIKKLREIISELEKI